LILLADRIAFMTFRPMTLDMNACRRDIEHNRSSLAERLIPITDQIPSSLVGRLPNDFRAMAVDLNITELRSLSNVTVAAFYVNGGGYLGRNIAEPPLGALLSTTPANWRPRPVKIIFPNMTCWEIHVAWVTFR
jgi:hypothetical protein